MFRRSAGFLGITKTVLTEGTGACPQPGSRIVCHYTGTFPKTGKVFDSSVQRGEPFQFQLSSAGSSAQVIACWDQTVLGMKKGEKCKIEATSDLCYGSRGAGGVIPPNADLAFEIELLDFK